jgi:hypothetical protein
MITTAQPPALLWSMRSRSQPGMLASTSSAENARPDRSRAASSSTDTTGTKSTGSAADVAQPATSVNQRAWPRAMPSTT